MTELEKFNEVWNGHFHKSKFWGGNDYSKRGAATKKRYEQILFSIWKHHPDWEEAKGFQIKARSKTIYRVIELAEEAGLLIKVKNYSVGNHTRLYHKNHKLFDAVFRNQNNQYYEWLKNFEWTKSESEYDIVHKSLVSSINNSKNVNDPYIDARYEIKSKKINKLNYDLRKLHILCQTMLPYYYDLLEELNWKIPHPDFFIYTWLKFDEKHLPTGRPYSYFCSTLNRKKKHKIIDPSMEYRDDFFKRIGLADYYEVYDIKSEIPRINHLFHTGEWKPDNYDFYEKIIDDFHIRMPDSDGDRVSRGKAGSEYYNDSMKQIFMRVYFGSGSEKQSFLGYKSEYMERNKESWENIKKSFPKFKKEDFYPYTFDEWYELSCSTEKICGKSIGNLAFWFAFFIQTEVKIELLKRGKNVFNVYDGFYYNQDISDEIREILKEKALFVYENYMINIKI